MHDISWVAIGVLLPACNSSYLLLIYSLLSLVSGAHQLHTKPSQAPSRKPSVVARLHRPITADNLAWFAVEI